MSALRGGFTTRPEIVGSLGVASSSHWLAAQTAMGVLERGGNAFDATVAGGLVLQVVEAHLNGPGGEAPILYWSESARQARAINGQGCAPAEATPAAFQRLGVGMVPGIGLLAATVPGAFAAWMTMLRDQGTWSLADVLAPAIGYARDGFPVTPQFVRALLGVRDLFTTHWRTSAAHWLPDGRVPKPGDFITRPALAATYVRIVEQAQAMASDRVGTIEAAMRVWHTGFVAREIDSFSRTQPTWDSTGGCNTGLLRFDDLAAWRPTLEEPLFGDFGRFRVAKCGFWSQGPMSLQVLACLRHAGLDGLEPTSPQFVHRIAESIKLALADRLAWYGTSPSINADALRGLLSEAYAKERWSSIAMAAASKELRPGSPHGHVPRLPDLSVTQRELIRSDVRFGIGEPTFAELPPIEEWPDEERFVGDTCHLSVIDCRGNMVAATPSGGWLSSSPTIPALGFSLGTRLQMAWLEEGLPGTLTPRVAPLTTLSPSLAFRDDEPYMAFGTPGGDQQDQWQAAFFVRHAVHGLSLQEAIDAPAFHVKHYAASFWPRSVSLNRLHVESRFPSSTIESLRAYGHDVVVGEPWSEGRLSACSRARDRSGRLVLKAAASPRHMQGYAVGR